MPRQPGGTVRAGPGAGARAGCARVPVSFIRTEQTTHRPQGCAVPPGPLAGEAHEHRTHPCTARRGWARRQGTPGEQP